VPEVTKDIPGYASRVGTGFDIGSNEWRIMEKPTRVKLIGVKLTEYGNLDMGNRF
jgi:hypothetical protein